MLVEIIPNILQIGHNNIVFYVCTPEIRKLIVPVLAI